MSTGHIPRPHVIIPEHALPPPKKPTMRETYEALLNGDPLTDEQLIEGQKFFDKLSQDLGACGPVFQLAAKEATRAYLAFDGYLQARRRK